MLNLEKYKKYLLACSHGPDSMALFYMLKEEGYNFAVAHVNYHLREESNSEQEQLEAYCKKNNVQLFVKDVDEVLGNNNLEEKCRIIRYSFFKELVNEHGFDAVLVAHNQDDLIETYIMQKCTDEFRQVLSSAQQESASGLRTIYDNRQESAPTARKQGRTYALTAASTARSGRYVPADTPCSSARCSRGCDTTASHLSACPLNPTCNISSPSRPNSCLRSGYPLSSSEFPALEYS